MQKGIISVITVMMATGIACSGYANQAGVNLPVDKGETIFISDKSDIYFVQTMEEMRTDAQRLMVKEYFSGLIDNMRTGQKIDSLRSGLDEILRSV